MSQLRKSSRTPSQFAPLRVAHLAGRQGLRACRTAHLRCLVLASHESLRPTKLFRKAHLHLPTEREFREKPYMAVAAGARNHSQLMAASGLPIDLPALHDEYNRFGCTDVLERISGNGHDVGELPDRELAAIFYTEEFCGVDRPGA